MLGAYNGVILSRAHRASFTRADLLHDFSGPTNRHDKSQRVNRP